MDLLASKPVPVADNTIPHDSASGSSAADSPLGGPETVKVEPDDDDGGVGKERTDMNSAIPPPGVAYIQRVVDAYEKPIIGAYFLVEYKSDATKQLMYVCELCNVYLDKTKFSNVCMHLSSEDHKHQFLRQTPNHEYNVKMVMQKRKVKNEMRDTYAKEIRAKEGPGKVRVADGEPKLKRKSLAGSNMKETKLKDDVVIKLADLDVPNFSEAFLQKHVDNYHTPIIGGKFVAEYHVDALHEPTYVCELCNTPGDKITMLSHLSGHQHRHKFLCQFPRHPYNLEGSKKEKEEERKEYAKYFHDKEGCGRLQVKFGEPVWKKKKDKQREIEAAKKTGGNNTPIRGRGGQNNRGGAKRPHSDSNNSQSKYAKNGRGGGGGGGGGAGGAGGSGYGGQSSASSSQRGTASGLRGKRGTFHAGLGGGGASARGGFQAGDQYASASNTTPIGGGAPGRGGFPAGPGGLQAPAGPGFVRQAAPGYSAFPPAQPGYGPPGGYAAPRNPWPR